METLEKTRIGSKVVKKYDNLKHHIKEPLNQMLYPLLLKRQIDKITQELWKAYKEKGKGKGKNTARRWEIR